MGELMIMALVRGVIAASIAFIFKVKSSFVVTNCTVSIMIINIEKIFYKVRGQDQDLVSRVQDGLQSDVKRTARAAGHDDLLPGYRFTRVPSKGTWRWPRGFPATRRWACKRVSPGCSSLMTSRMVFRTSSGGSRFGFPRLKSKTLSAPNLLLSSMPCSNIFRIQEARSMVFLNLH